LGRVDVVQKIRDRKQTTVIEKCSFVNWTINNWNQLPDEVFGFNLLNLRILETILGKQL
jgi:hypothetical protein